MSNMEYLEAVAKDDVQLLREKDASYGGSWKRRGGVGAFMMLARKWDRIEQHLEKQGTYDIFSVAESDDRAEPIRNDLDDLRCYLILVESELRDRASQLIDTVDMP